MRSDTLDHYSRMWEARAPMTRLGRIVAAALILGVLVPASAFAEQRATFAQTANMTPALGRFPGGYYGPPGHHYHYVPPICERAWISTANRTWASITFHPPAGAPGCIRYESNGLAILHLEDHHWRVVTAGSAFRCPILSYHGQPRVPENVVRDLISRRLGCA